MRLHGRRTRVESCLALTFFGTALLQAQSPSPSTKAAAARPLPTSVGNAARAHDRRPAVFACAYCHLPDGMGRPENAMLAGLPADYIIAQVAAMRSGTRRAPCLA